MPNPYVIDETLHEFLERREHELTNKVRDLRAELDPLEKELIEIRRTRASLGIARPFDLLVPTPSEAAANSAMKRDDDYRSLANTIRHTPPQSLKIKELIVLAFVSHFHASAAPQEISHYIRKAYKRDIDSGSIRPNLGRLREDGILMQGANSKWILDPTAANVILPQYHAADPDEWMLEAAKKLAWKDDEQPDGKSEPPYGQAERPVKD